MPAGANFAPVATPPRLARARCVAVADCIDIDVVFTVTRARPLVWLTLASHWNYHMEEANRSRFSRYLSMFLPGIFLLGFNIGTGSVTAMAKAGATYGMSLLWTIAASCLATFVMINIYGKYTLVTGETALQAFRKHIHPAVGVFFIVALTAGVSGSVIGVMGIVADISFLWSKTIVVGSRQR